MRAQMPFPLPRLRGRALRLWLGLFAPLAGTWSAAPRQGRIATPAQPIPLRLAGDEMTAAREHERNPDAPAHAGWVEVRWLAGGIVELRALRDAPIGADSVVRMRVAAGTLRRWLASRGTDARTLARRRCATPYGAGRVAYLHGSAVPGTTPPDDAERLLNLACRRAPDPAYWVQIVAGEGQNSGGLVTTSAETWLRLLEALSAAARAAGSGSARSPR